MLEREILASESNQSNNVQVVSFQHSHYKHVSIYFDPHALDLLTTNNTNDRERLMKDIAAAIALEHKDSHQNLEFYILKAGLENTDSYQICGVKGPDEHTTYHGIKREDKDRREGVVFAIQDVTSGKLPDYFNHHRNKATFARCEADCEHFEKTHLEIQARNDKQKLDDFVNGKIIIPAARQPRPTRQYHEPNAYNIMDATKDLKELAAANEAFTIRQALLEKFIIETQQQLTLIEQESSSKLKDVATNAVLTKYIQEEYSKLSKQLNSTLASLVEKKSAIEKFIAKPEFAEAYIAYLNHRETLIHIKRLVAWALQEAAADYFEHIQTKDNRKALLDNFGEHFAGIASIEGWQLIYCDELSEKMTQRSLEEIRSFLTELLSKCNAGVVKVFKAKKIDCISKALEFVSDETKLTVEKTSIIQGLGFEVVIGKSTQELENNDPLNDVKAQVENETDDLLRSVQDREIDSRVERDGIAHTEMVARIDQQTQFIAKRRDIASTLRRLEAVNNEIKEINANDTEKETGEDEPFEILMATAFLGTPDLLPETPPSRKKKIERADYNLKELQESLATQTEILNELKEAQRQEKLNVLKKELAQLKAACSEGLDGATDEKELEKYFKQVNLSAEYHNYKVNMAAIEEHENACDDYDVDTIEATRLSLNRMGDQLKADFKALTDALASKKALQLKQIASKEVTEHPLSTKNVSPPAKRFFAGRTSWGGTFSPKTEHHVAHSSASNGGDDGKRGRDEKDTSPDAIPLIKPRLSFKPQAQAPISGKVVGVLVGAGMGALVGAGIGAFIGFFLAPVTFGASVPALAAVGAVIGGTIGGLIGGGILGLGLGHLYDKWQQTPAEGAVIQLEKYPSPKKQGDYPKADVHPELSSRSRATPPVDTVRLSDTGEQSLFAKNNSASASTASSLRRRHTQKQNQGEKEENSSGYRRV